MKTAKVEQTQTPRQALGVSHSSTMTLHAAEGVTIAVISEESNVAGKTTKVKLLIRAAQHLHRH